MAWATGTIYISKCMEIDPPTTTSKCLHFIPYAASVLCRRTYGVDTTAL